MAQTFTVPNWERRIAGLPLLTTAIEVIAELEKYGLAFIVGGAVRDFIMGVDDPADIDIATNVSMYRIEALFRTHDIGKNKDFGILVVEHGGCHFEVAQFRSDGAYSDGRHPDSVVLGVTPREDMARRDFTVNALCMDAKGAVFDHFGGLNDINAKIIRTVGDPDARFGEDNLRMLRAVRFAARLGFSIDRGTFDSIKRNARAIQNISVERVTAEIMVMADRPGPVFALALEHLKETGLLRYIIPEADRMDNYEHDEDTHPEGNVWEHTLAAIRVNDMPDRIVNLAILFHDVGKPLTQTYYDEGRIRFFGHPHEGALLVQEVARRMKLDNHTAGALSFAAEHHMKIWDLRMSPSRFMRLMESAHWDTLLRVAYCDHFSRGIAPDDAKWEQLIAKIEELKNKFSKERALQNIARTVNGGLIMRIKGISEGKLIGEYKARTIEWILDNDIDIEDRQAIENYILGLE